MLIMDILDVFCMAKNGFGWELLDDSVSVAVERGIDPLVSNVTINFKVIRHETDKN